MIKEALPTDYTKNYKQLTKNFTVAPDTSIKALIGWMRDTYNMEYVGYQKGIGKGMGNGEYIFKKNNGSEARYTTKELKDLGAPIGLMNIYNKRIDRSGSRDIISGRGKPMREIMKKETLGKVVKLIVEEVQDELDSEWGGDNPALDRYLRRPGKPEKEPNDKEPPLPPATNEMGLTSEKKELLKGYIKELVEEYLQEITNI